MNTTITALLESLQQAPLLVGDLTEAKCFERALLAGATPQVGISLQQKLGHLYEDVLEALLDASDQVERIASHVQVSDVDGRTLGELDFLLRDVADGCYIHLELAVKFYLAVEQAGEWHFPGPDPRDNWLRKLERLRSHQLVMSQTPQARRLLQERFGVESVKVRQLIYGCIFYPMSQTSRPLPQAVDPESRSGRWLYLSEWERFFSGVDYVHPVPKALWPVEMSAALKEQLTSVSVATLKADAQERCTLFVPSDGVEAIFLVPDSWPMTGSFLKKS